MSFEWKRAARASLKGKWWPMIGLFAVMMVLNGAAQIFTPTVDTEEVSAVTSLLSLVSLVLQIALIPIFVGWVWLALGVVRGDEATVSRLFEPFKVRYGRHVLGGFLVNLFVTLWALLFVIPGIVKAISYSLTYYILKDRPELSALEAITESRRMMYGHKWQAFKLTLSFIGWFFLGVLTVGLAFFYVIPYYTVTYSHFYESVRDADGASSNDMTNDHMTTDERTRL